MSREESVILEEARSFLNELSTEANDALHQAHARLGGKGAAAAAAAAEEALRAVMAVLMHCQFAAEKAAGIGEDDDDDDDRGAGMRLVRG